MSKSKRRLGHFARRTRFESLEQRIVLDTQIGAVTMPYDGYLSAAVYGPNGEFVRSLFARAPEEKGVSIPLMWDGMDATGHKALTNGTYTWKALTSQVETVDQGSIADSGYSSQYFVNVTDDSQIIPNASSNVRSVAADSAGNVYNISGPVEFDSAAGVQKYGPDGKLVIDYALLGDGVGAATDGDLSLRHRHDLWHGKCGQKDANQRWSHRRLHVGRYHRQYGNCRSTTRGPGSLLDSPVSHTLIALGNGG